MSTPPSQQRPVIGILWMALSGLCFLGVNTLIKAIGTEIPAVESAFIRFGFGLIFVLPALMHTRFTDVSASTWRWIGLRGLVHSLAVTLWFFSMARLPLAEVTALNYLNPIFVTLGGALIFHERFGPRRALAIGVAFAGALVVLRPGFRDLQMAQGTMVGAAFCLAAGYLIAKRLSAELSAGQIVAALSITVTLVLLPFALAVWVAPSPRDLIGLFAVACFATAGHYTMIRAFQNAPLSVVQPVTFLQLVWSVIVGAALFHEPLDPWVLLGGSMIIAAIGYITWREARNKA